MFVSLSGSAVVFRPRLNQLSGTIPTELALIGGDGARLVARGNLLNGTIPSEIFGISGLGKNAHVGSPSDESSSIENLSLITCYSAHVL